MFKFFQNHVSIKKIIFAFFPVLIIAASTLLADPKWLMESYKALLSEGTSFKLVFFSFVVHLKNLQMQSPQEYTAIVGVGGFVISSIISFAYKILKERKKFRSSNELITESGLYLFTDSIDEFMSSSSSEIFSSTNLGYKNGTLSFMVISGGVTLNNKDFKKIISDHKGLIRVLLHDNDTDFSKKRAEHTKISHATYKKRAKTAQNFLIQMKKSGKNIEVRNYKSAPLFKLVFNQKICVCHGYFEDSSVFGGLELSEGNDGFHGLFEQAFESLWNDSKVVHTSGS